MILEQSRILVELLDTKRKLSGNLKKAGGFRTRRDEIRTLTRRLSPLVKSSCAFRNKNIGPVDMGGQTNKMEKIVIEVIETVKQRPESITNAGGFKKLINEGNDFCTELQIKLITLWNDYLRSSRPEINDVLLDVLGSQPSFAQPVNQLRKIAEEIEMSRDLPQEEEQIERYKQLVLQMRSIWDGIEGGAVPPDVLKFLQNAVSTTGAPLDLLTDDVKAWLGDRGVKRSFKIRLSS